MTLTGTTGSYADIQGLELFSERFLKQTDIDNNSYVVVITKDTATELLGRVDAVGGEHQIKWEKFSGRSALRQHLTDSGCGSDQLFGFGRF